MPTKKSPRIGLAELCRSLPQDWPIDPRPAIARALTAAGQKLVVLDDDPTGTQTVHDVPVLTDWTVETLAAELASSCPTFFLLTNSRSLSLADAYLLNRTIGSNLRQAAERAGRKFVVASRSDSTLRGHFPGEVEGLVEGLGEHPDGMLLLPFFLAGGRYTVADIHYVTDGDTLVPSADSEYARDPIFGYRSSDLRQWVQEKTHGRVAAESVHSISIEDIRLGGPDRVAGELANLHSGAICVVNAVSMRDLELFTLGLLIAELKGKRFIYRTAASFIPVRCGVAPGPLLGRNDFSLSAGGGLTVVGSLVEKSTRQLCALLAQTKAVSLELDAEALVDPSRCAAETARAVNWANRGLARGQDMVIFTSRHRVECRSAEESLCLAGRISAGLARILGSISVRPRYLLVKGGITASDIATAALSVRRAMIRGQVLPGVPVWRLGPESRHPGLDYIVFPGNVGDDQALVDIHTLLREVPAARGLS